MTSFPPRHAISRADFFLTLASSCTASQKNDFEAFLEAAIIFARTAIHRLQHEFKHHPDWPTWFQALKGNPSIDFFKEHRDLTLKESSPKVGQRIGFQSVSTAEELYFFQPDEPAIKTVRNHLNTIAKIVYEASTRFNKPPTT